MIAPAKRGDLALFAVEHSYVTAQGGHVRKTTYELRRVVNVTREGRVTGYVRRSESGNEFYTKPRANVFFPCWIIRKAELRNAEECFRALGAIEFESLDDARAALMQYRVQEAAKAHGRRARQDRSGFVVD